MIVAWNYLFLDLQVFASHGVFSAQEFAFYVTVLIFLLAFVDCYFVHMCSA